MMGGNSTLVRTVKSMAGILAAAFIMEPGFAGTDNNDGVTQRWYVAPSLNYTSFDSEINIDNGVGFDASFGYRLDDRLSVQGGWLNVPTDLDRRDGDANIDQVHLDLLYHWPAQTQYGIHPFLLGSIASLHTETDIDGDEENYNHSQVGLGGGADYPLNQRWVLRAELRAFYSPDIETIDVLTQFSVVYRFGGNSGSAGHWWTLPNKSPVVMASGGPWYLTNGWTHFRLDDNDETEFANTNGYNIRVGYQYNRLIAVQGAWAVTTGGDDNGLNQFQLDGVYRLPQFRFRGWEPFALAGLAHSRLERGLSDHVQLGIGGGVEYTFTDGWALQADLRGYHSFKHDQMDWATSVGVAYHFGASAPTGSVYDKRDKDQDGVPDAVDQCRDTSAGAPTNVYGCTQK